MFKQLRDKVALSGITVLLIGVALLIFTFISAYGFLTQNLSIIASEDLVHTFGEALAPLISTSIRIMYLGVMGWIGSLLTIRGITILAHLPQSPAVTPPRLEVKQQLQRAKAEKTSKELPKPEAKSTGSTLIVIPPEEASRTALQTIQPEKSNPQPSS
jgi:hypothetical protein